jgi:hypothetical protein
MAIIVTEPAVGTYGFYVNGVSADASGAGNINVFASGRIE